MCVLMGVWTCRAGHVQVLCVYEYIHKVCSLCVMGVLTILYTCDVYEWVCQWAYGCAHGCVPTCDVCKCMCEVCGCVPVCMSAFTCAHGCVDCSVHV